MKRGLAVAILLCVASTASADPPSTAYVFPAGGQRGTAVNVRVGGHYLHDRAKWEVLGAGVSASPELTRTERIWFEGPVIRQPASQQKEDYPQDYAGRIEIAADAATGPRLWRAFNAQGVTTAMPFVVGDLPEVVEEEIDGRPLPVSVTLPLTINGRIFPREDVDVWSFNATAGQSVTLNVATTELGSPLEAQLEIRDPQGRVVAESDEALLRFMPAETGVYQSLICDSRFAGLQQYVYRLTITADAWVDRIYPLGGRRGTDVTFEVAGQKTPATVVSHLPDATGIVRHALTIDGKAANALLCDVDELEEVLEANNTRPALPVPGVANGRIAAPAERDVWTFTATKGVALQLALRAARLGSPLDGVLVVKDEAGKEMARGDDLPNSPDCEVAFTAPADGKYLVEVSDKFSSRGGPAFAYRLRIAPAKPDFELSVALDSLNVDVGAEKKCPVVVQRVAGFNGPIKLTVASLPAGATAAEVVVAPNQNQGEIAIKLDKTVPVQTARLTIVGRSEHEGQSYEHNARLVPAPALDHLLLACTLPTPFKFQGNFEIRYTARGGTLTKSYKIERNGYEGPLQVCLADKQGRHLQGVTGPTITVPADKSEFEYTLTLPPWMELGRTSRSNLMLTGEVPDAAGQRHKVCFSTVEQNEQLIALVSPGPLRLSLPRAAWPCAAGQELVVPVQIHRDRALQGPVHLELVLPRHVRDVTAAAIDVPAGATTAEFRLQLGANAGPFNQPLVIRGTSDHHGQPMVAEALIELIPK
jgi:hypothetical protein